MRDTNTEEGCSYSERCNKNLRITVCANQGGRKYMEDRVHIEQVRSSDGTLDYTYVAVYDGHGGADASEFVRKNLLRNIEKQDGFNRSDEEMLQAIRKGFIETHYAMLEVVDCWPLTASGYRSTAGTTASVAFITHGKIFTGHVGDSAIIVGKKQGGTVSGICLTVDHKPDNLTEEERINKAGGTIMRKSGVMRVVWTRPLKGHVGPVRRSTPTENIAFLAVARSLGDLWSYNKATNQFIVSPEPDVSVYVLDSTDFCLVLGSDGLTNVLKPQQIVDIVQMSENDNNLSNCHFVNHSRVLLRTALRGWGSLRADNITVVTVMFDSAECDPVMGSLYESCASNSGCNLDLDKLFTEHQTDMVRITDKCCQEFSTVPVNIVYSGALDHQFSSDIAYSGPGFTKQIVRDNPVLPSKSSLVFARLRRSVSYGAVSQQQLEKPGFSDCTESCCASTSEVNDTRCNDDDDNNDVSSCNGKQSNCMTAESQTRSLNQSSESLFITTSSSSMYTERFTEAFNETSVTDINRFHKKPVDGSNSLPSLGVEVKSTSRVCPSEVGHNLENCDSEDDLSNNSNIFFNSSSPSKEDQTLPNTNKVASTNAKPVAVVSPFETTPTSSGRKGLVSSKRVKTFLRQRGAARRNLMTEPNVINQLENHNMVTTSCEDKKSEFSKGETTTTSAESDIFDHNDTVSESEKLTGCRRSHLTGSASALSPVLMLAALRAPEQLLLRRSLDDPLRNDLISVRHTRYCSSVIPTASRFGELKLGDGSRRSEKEKLPHSQKRKAQVDNNANLAVEPAPKRSRFWEFFSNLIGDRKSK